MADDPTLLQRMLAGLAAGLTAFLIVQLLLGLVIGIDWMAAGLASLALAIAAILASMTLRRARAVTFAILGVFWLMAEALVLLVGAVVSLS